MINKEGKGVKVDDTTTKSTLNFKEGVLAFCKTRLTDYQIQRHLREDIWAECWSLYIGSPEARNEMRGQMLRTTGNVNTEWRHNINTGKAFEQVETIVGYLMQAFFPNRDWFEAQPVSPGYSDLSKIMKHYTSKKLKEAKFISNWEMFIRQMCITGQSVLAMPWRYEEKKVKKNVRKRDGSISIMEQLKVMYNNNEFETLDIFDVYTDYNCFDIEKAPVVRRLLKDKAECIELLQDGYYSGITLKEMMGLDGFTDGIGNTTSTAISHQDRIKRFQGVEVGSAVDKLNDKIELFEYWGDIIVEGYVYKDHYAVWTDNYLLRFEPNPFAYGKPFIYGTYTPIPRSMVALGVIEPSLGMLHEFDIITNQRLDNLELSADSMWEHIDDGSLEPQDIFTKPGKVFTVAQPNTVTPIQTPKNFVITYDEANVLEQRIDKNAGTGNLISANAARKGERVTAAEIQATRDAGGNRLSAVHKHIEETSLIPFLDKLFRSYQQFITDEEIVRIPSGQEPGAYDYVAVGLEDFYNDFKLVPVGADHVTDREFEVNQRMAFLQMVSQNEEMSQNINYYAFMMDIARRMGIDDVELFIKEPQQEQMPEQQMMPQQSDTIANTLGVGSENALNAELAADGGQSLAKDMLDLDLDTEAIQAALSNMRG